MDKTMYFQGKKIGIWGFGITGKSVLNFFAHQGAILSVLDNRSLSPDEMTLIKELGASLQPPEALHHFLTTHDYIVPSSGIDLQPYAHLTTTNYICELDLFADCYTKPIIALTGSYGKTSIVTLLGQLLQRAGHRIVTGGNIGVPMLSLIEQPSDGILLELSSFQLALSHRFAPDLAIITNLCANHLDRHGTLANYLAAKCTIMRYQRGHQKALLPWSLHTTLPTDILTRSTTAFFADCPLNESDYTRLLPQQRLYSLENNVFFCWQDGYRQQLHQSSFFSTITYPVNWLIIASALHMLNVPLAIIDQHHAHLTIPDHRLQLIADYGGIRWYNDSKSTVPETTLAAVNAFSPHPIILFLGGVSKGINRQPLIDHLVHKVKHILCFGKEALQLAEWCQKAHINHSQHTTLDEAFYYSTTITQAGDIILLSPAGASYDLFQNYHQRGDHFVALVKHFIQNK